ncbi:putative ribonuclease H-like domain-containing protein, partial [Tanacetum coccineum]
MKKQQQTIVVPDEDETVDLEILSVKYPIVDWESQNLGSVDMEDIYVYKIIRADGNTSYDKTFSSMLRKLNRQDLLDLHRLVMKRFEDNTLEGYTLLLWGDLKIMFEPNAKDEIWSNQQDWILISWKLYENYGVHSLLMDEAKAESTMAFELLKFIKSQAEAVNTTCYVQNRVLVTKPHNKNPYELFLGRKPALGFMKPFGCPVTILNTIDHLGKFDGKVDEGFFVGYSINRSGPNWLFDIDALTKTMNYKPVVAGNQSNGNAGTKAYDDASKARMETSSPDAGFKPSGDDEKKVTEEPGKEGGDPSKEDESNDQEQDDNVNNTNNVNTASNENNTNNANTVSSTVNAAGIVVNAIGRKSSIKLPDDPNMPELEDIVYSDDDEDVGAEADINNLDVFMPISPIPTTRIHKDHSIEQIVRDLNSTPQTRRMTKNLEEHEEPKKVIHALKDPCWIEAMQDELLQFKLQKVWTMVDLPNGKRSIRTKWVYRNKKVERGIVIKNKERLVAQGHTQEEGIDYDEVFSPIARIEAIRLFLAYASFKDFVVHKMDVKSVFLYGKIEEEVYVCQPLGFEDPDFPDRVYKVEKALY